MIPRFWQLPLCLCGLSLGLTALHLPTVQSAFRQTPLAAHGAMSAQAATADNSDSDYQPTVQFVFENYYVAEDGGPATIYVYLSTSSSDTVTVDYSTSDGTATAPTDYESASGTLTFSSGTTSMTFSVTVNNSGFSQNRTVNLTLSNPTNATLGNPNPALLTIVPPNTLCPLPN
jgi:hypothetical protein